MYNWRGKKLLILGATKLMEQIIDIGRAYGAKVYVVDYNVDSPAKKSADYAFLADATDVDTIVDLIKKHQIDGVITGFADSLLPAYYEICTKAKLPCYLTPKHIEFTTNKKMFREYCKKFHIPNVKEYTKENVQFPLIVKPVDNSGSRGISLCNDYDEYKKAVEGALSFSKSKNILIEEYVHYKEATIFYIFVDGKYYFSLMADRNTVQVKDGYIKLPNGYTFPSPHSQTAYDALHDKFSKMFKELEIKNGIMFIQCFIDDKGLCIPYEPGFRITASLEHLVMQKSCAYSSMAMLINFALTNSMVNSPDTEGKITPFIDDEAYNLTCLIKPGKIMKIQGLKEIVSDENVLGYFQSYVVGDELPEDQYGKLSQIFLRIIFYGNEEKYAKFTQLINEKLEVLTQEGENLFLKNM